MAAKDRLSGKRGKTPPRDEVARRLHYVEIALSALTPLAELYPKFRQQFNVGQRCAEDYVRRVHDQWAAESAAADGGAARVAKRVAIEHAADLVFRQGLASGDRRSMLAALELKAKLHGLASQRHEHSGPDGGAIPHAHRHDVDAAALCARIGALAPGPAGGAPGGGAPAAAAADDPSGAPSARPPGGAAGG